jgi:hypothetical protein
MVWQVAGAARTRILDFAAHRGPAPASVVSLHAHTHHSRESLAELPGYVASIPIVARLFAREVRRSQSGVAVDFSRGWWRPPVSPRAVFESEASQIEARFDAAAMVSVTDHDSIAAGLELRRTYAGRCAPLSFEWTVPWKAGFFHIGVHNLPAGDAGEWFGRLTAFARGKSHESLSGLIVDLHDTDGVLVVFNHPAWDIARIGDAAHRGAVRAFLDAHGRFLHAIEVNGYRSALENAAACRLAGEIGLPVISGGDRHGCAANVLLNATAAETFAEFAAEVRAGRSDVIVMPEYHEPLPGRMLASIADVLRHYEGYPSHRRRWTDRVSCEWQGAEQPLSALWPHGGPFWVRSTIRAIGLLSARRVAPIVNRGFAWSGRGSQGSVGQSVSLADPRAAAVPDARPMNV